MKSVGEAMAIGRTFQQAFLKAMRSRELDMRPKLDGVDVPTLLELLERPAPDRFDVLLAAFRAGASIEDVQARTSIDPWFLRELSAAALDPDAVFAGERSFRAVDTCAAEFAAETPYYYSGWERTRSDEVRRGDRPSVVILGAGPNRIGQGIEFDYCCVHAAMTVREAGRDAVMVNCNPETVSTDYDTSDRLYFEPLTLEDVLGVVEAEQPEGVIVQFGGQTPLKLAHGLEQAGVTILGTSVDAIDLAEDRGRFSALLDSLGYAAPPYATATSVEEAIAAAPEVGWPLLVRPSYVLGGRAMEIVYDLDGLRDYLSRHAIRARRAVRRSSWTASWRTRSRSTSTRCATARTSGSAGSCSTSRRPASTRATAPACCRRTRSGPDMLETIREHTRGIALGLGVVGLINIQYGINGGGKLYVIEANPRASRTVPFVSKAIGLPLAKMACRLMLGEKLARPRPAGGPDGLRPRLGQGGRAAVRPLRGRRRDPRAGDALDRRGHGRRARLPDGVRQGPGRRGRAAAPAGDGVHHGDRLRQVRRARHRRPALRRRLPGRRDGGHGPGDPRHGRPVRRRSTRSPRARPTSST